MSAHLPGVPPPLTGATRLVAIVGDPIDQAGSPGLFNAAFSARGIGAVLVPLHVSPADLASLVATFRATRNWDGLVVTVPHKVAIAEYMDELETPARRVGAVNAIRKGKDGQLIGSNFDGAGFVQGLRSSGQSLQGSRILVIGAGGAGRAICHAVADENPASLTITDIDSARAAELARSVNAEQGRAMAIVGLPAAAGHDVIINCTPPAPSDLTALPLSLVGLSNSAFVADIVLKPSWTPLLEAAKAAGCRTHTGINMLSGQVDAVLAFFRMTGRQAD